MKMTNSSSEGFVARTIVLTLATMLAALLLPGVSIDGVWAAICTAVVISILDNLLRPILIVVTLPVTIMTLGLFVFAVNAILIMLASKMVNGFHVSGFGAALAFSLLLTLFNYLLELPRRNAERQEYQENDHNRQIEDDHFDDYEEIK